MATTTDSPLLVRTCSRPGFVPEREALARMDRAVEPAEQLLDDPEASPTDKARLREATRASRTALSQYQQLRRRGRTRATALAEIAPAPALIVTGDATVIGVADDVALAPLVRQTPGS